MGVCYLVELTAEESWLSLVKAFEAELKQRLRSRLKGIIARSSSDDLVYESNVLVVVDRADLEAIRAVVEAASAAQERTGLEGLSPMTVSQEDRHVIKVFT
ncbi:MAG: hypothetical protein DRN99_06495 [Thermoproteota archaeon]|nr:MAG: hypothetical protein DRN99_06495 [Candidatus Korarchaeota archaeon]